LIPESGIVSVGRDSLLVPDSKDLSGVGVVEGGGTVVFGGARVEVLVSGTAIFVEGASVVVEAVIDETVVVVRGNVVFLLLG
jgi:hypothetical protein